MKRRAVLCILILAALIAGLTLLAHRRHNAAAQKEDELYVTVLRPGEGDAVVLTCGEDTMVLCSGRDNENKDLESFLRGRGLEQIDLLAGPGTTAPGGLNTNAVQVSDRRSHSELLGKAVTLGSAKIKFYPADRKGAVLITVEHGENRLTMLTGEVHEEVSLEDSDLLMFAVPETDTDELQKIVAKATPEYAVLLDQRTEPADRHAEILKARDIEVLQLSESSVRITSDGKELEMQPEFGIWE